MVFRRADTNEMHKCAEILKDAFRGYDFFEIYVNNPKRRKIFFETMMDIWMKNSFKNGTVLVGTENDSIVSIAVLKAPNDREIDFIDRSLKSLKLVLAGGYKNTKAFLNMCEISDEACHKLPNPKWHLVLLAVSSKYKGTGIGSTMLQEHIIPYIAHNGGGLFTFNTNTEVNRPFYKKNGFEEFDECVLNENGKEMGNWSYKMTIAPI